MGLHPPGDAGTLGELRVLQKGRRSFVFLSGQDPRYPDGSLAKGQGKEGRL